MKKSTIVLSVIIVLLAAAEFSSAMKINALESSVAKLSSQATTQTVVLSDKMMITAHWEKPDGTQVLPPETMPLWKYIQDPDNANAKEVNDFKFAFEDDLHNHDLTFHLTHEFIDGKKW